MFSTIYDIANEILLYVIRLAENFKEKQEAAIIKFLISDNTRYEEILNNYDDYITDRLYLKKIMMLCVISGAYKTNVYDLNKDISYDIVSEIVDEMESLNLKNIYSIFKNYHKNSKIVDYTADYIDYITANYIYGNDCTKAIIAEDKEQELFRINPLEMLNKINYKEVVLPSERIIGDLLFIDKKIANDILTQIEIGEIEEEYDEQAQKLIYQEKFFDFIEEIFNEEQIKIFCGYILGKTYENFKIMIFDDQSDPYYKEYLEYFENGSTDLNVAYNRFRNDLDFFDEIVLYFLDYCEDLEYDDLVANRSDLKLKGGTNVLKKFNLFYNIEEKAFNGPQKAKN